MQITWIEHSCFKIELEHVTLIFDAFRPERMPLDKTKKTIFLASHHHQDHYCPQLSEHGIDQIWYVLSRDIFGTIDDHHIKVKPYQQLTVEGVSIETLKSTDEGVAFLIEAEGWSIYHAGDLNWWHWEAENEQDVRDNEIMKQRYQRQLDRVAGRCFDLAMIPADPRLKEAYFWGLDAWMKNTETKWIAPMHTFGENQVVDLLLHQPECQAYANRILDLRGGPLELTKKGCGL